MVSLQVPLVAVELNFFEVSVIGFSYLDKIVDLFLSYQYPLNPIILNFIVLKNYYKREMLYKIVLKHYNM